LVLITRLLAIPETQKRFVTIPGTQLNTIGQSGYGCPRKVHGGWQKVFDSTKLSITRASMPEQKQARTASLRLTTKGSPNKLNDVLMSRGAGAISPKRFRSRQHRGLLCRLTTCSRTRPPGSTKPSSTVAASAKDKDKGDRDVESSGEFKILKLMREQTAPISEQEISSRLNIRLAKVQQRMDSLLDSGEIEQVPSAHWQERAQRGWRLRDRRAREAA